MASQVRNKRPAPLSIRLTEAERKLLVERSGYMPLSSYIKSIVLQESAPSHRKRQRIPDQNDKLLGQILTRLGSSRVPNNLNQIAKHLNQGTLLIDEDLVADIQVAVEDIAWIRSTLTQALGVKR